MNEDYDDGGEHDNEEEYEEINIPTDFPEGITDSEGRIVMSAEEELLRRAIIEFQNNFTRYVKEMDPHLWKRAIQYAKDYTQIEGVTFAEDFEFRYEEDEKNEQED
jgi:hypothetical protein